MSIEKLDSKTREVDQSGWKSGFLGTKKRSPRKSSEDSLLMRRNKAKNLHMFLSEIMRKLKHSFKMEKPQHDKRLSGKEKRLQRSASPTKDRFFLERITSISQKRSHHDEEEHLSEMLNNGDSDQTRTVSLSEFSSPFTSPGRSPTVLSRSASEDFNKSETFADDTISIKEIETAPSPGEGGSPSISKRNRIVDFEISQFEAYDGDEEGGASHEESLHSVASPSHNMYTTEECNLAVEPLFFEYEISPETGEAKRQPLCNQIQENNHHIPMDEVERVFKYVREVLEAIDSSWEEMYLKTEFSDQILNPALISNIPFYPSQLCVDHELLFDCINVLLFEFCSFPQWVSVLQPRRTQVFSFSAESIVQEFQKEVCCRLFPLQFSHSTDHIIRQDMSIPRNWLDIRCDLECIGFETSELILDELLEQLMLDF
ncbi:unnamed protein product, partial [Thlaspi arvense]